MENDIKVLNFEVKFNWRIFLSCVFGIKIAQIS